MNNNINYEALYEKIIESKPKNKEQLQVFIEFVNEMSKNDGGSPLYYDLESMVEYAKIFNRKEKLNKVLN